MRKHSKEFTEPIFAALDQYRAELAAHPLLEAGRTGSLSTTTLFEFAFQQYSDSITWIPMLAQMKGRATRSARLRTAIEDNIAHEAGLGGAERRPPYDDPRPAGGTSHVTLAVWLLRSLGITSLDAFDTTTFGATASMWLGDGFADMPEPAVAGFLLTAETLVPQMFAAMKPSFDRVANADTRYFSEHIAVDADEHATWMAEAVEEVVALYGPESVPIVLAGMADAWTETREVPDALWQLDGGGRTCASP